MNLIDKAYRHQLIERYLDAETSIEEEKALADFYRQSQGSELTEEDIYIRNLMLGLEIAAHNTFTKEVSLLGEEATDVITLAESAPIGKSLARKQQPKHLWVRFSAIFLAAAMLAGLIFLVFPSHRAEKPNFAALTPAQTVIRSQQNTSNDYDGTNHDAMSLAEHSEMIDSAFLADTKDIVNPKDVSKLASSSKKKDSATKESSAFKETSTVQRNLLNQRNLLAQRSSMGKTQSSDEIPSNEEATSSNDYYQIYEVASTALPSAEQLKIENQGDKLVITAIDDNGNAQHFSVSVDNAAEGAYQLQPLLSDINL